MRDGKRETGIDIVGKVGWGSHFCVFYHDKEELASILVDYVKAGLEANEACVWVTSGTISPEEAKEALAKVMPDFSERTRTGQLEILRAKNWYTPNGRFDAKDVLASWRKKAALAEERGFDGLRATGDTSWLSDEQWEDFVEYESSIEGEIRGKNMLVLCSYSLDLWEAWQMIDVVSTHEFALIMKDGSWRQIENSERRKSMEMALEAEEKYQRVVGNIRVAVYSALPDERSTTVLLSDKIEQITGYTAKEFLDDPELFATMIVPEDREIVWASIREHRAKKGPLKVQYRIRTKSGDLRWVKDEAVPVLDESGNIVRIDGFVENVTDYKELEEALAGSEERYKLAQKAANMGSWDLQISTGKLLWSDEIEPIFGFGAGQFSRTYEGFLSCVHPDDRKLVTESVQACLEGRKEYDLEHRIQRPDGTVRWVSEKGDVIRDSQGRPIRMVGIVHDVTKNKLDELRIRQLNAELEAFAYSVSHDLRAPLRRIDGFSDILQKDNEGKLNEESRRHIERIRASVKKMETLIDDVLRLSRLTTAVMEVQEVDLAKLASQTVDDLKSSTPDRSVKVDIHEDLKAKGDPNLLKMAIDNLIGNAWKFTGTRREATIEFGALTVDGQKAFYVKDNGVGFDMAHASKLFDPFQRLHDESEFPGSGIGLAIVKRIVTRHGGRIWAESEDGKGATFYFTLSHGNV